MRRLKAAWKRLGNQRVPRGAVIALCAMVVAPPAGMVIAHNPNLDSSSHWIHHHTLEYSYCNLIPATGSTQKLHDAVDAAAANWQTRFSENGSPVTFPSKGSNATDCHPSGTPATAMQFESADFGDIGWRASNIADSNPSYNQAYLAAHTHVKFNTTTVGSNTMNNYIADGSDHQALACKQIGQVIGVATLSATDRTNESNASPNTNDCMSFGGAPPNQCASWETGTSACNVDNGKFTYKKTAESHSMNVLLPRYADITPTMTLSGTLPEASSWTAMRSDSSYTLHVGLTRATNQEPGAYLTDVRVSIDSVQKAQTNSSCGSAGNCDISADYTFGPSDLPAGWHQIDVVATDALGLKVKRTWFVGIASPPTGSGLLDDMSLQQETLSDGTDINVNSANGNLVVHAFDGASSQVGDDPWDVTIDRYYNGRVSPSGAFGPGWSMSTGQDVHLDPVSGGGQRLYGPSGYVADFTRNSDGTYTPPSSVWSHLVDASGGGHVLNLYWLNQILTFNAAGRLTASDDGSGQTSLSYDANGRLSTLTDPGGKVSTLTYSNGRVSRVTLPDGRHGDYSYTGAGRLASYTDPNGKTEAYAYADNDANLTKLTPPTGPATDFTYDSQKRAKTVQQTGDSFSTFWLDYSTAGQTSVVNTQGVQTQKFPGGGPDPVMTEETNGGATPTMTLSGSLYAAAGGSISASGSAQLTVAAQAPSGGGVDHIDFLANAEDEIDQASQDCSSTCGDFSHTFDLDLTGVPPGDYVLGAEVVAKNGSEYTKRFRVTVGNTSAAAPTTSDTDGSDPSLSSPDVKEQAIEFRDTYNLTYSDAQLVAAFDAQNNAAYTSSMDAYGTPLLPSEKDTVDQRVANEKYLAVIDQYGSSRSDFAGSYIDPTNGTVHAEFKEGDPGRTTDLAALGASIPSSALRVDEVARSQSQLDAVGDQLTDQLLDNDDSDLVTQAIGIDAVTNQVIVMEPPSQVDAANQQQTLDTVASKMSASGDHAYKAPPNTTQSPASYLAAEGVDVVGGTLTESDAEAANEADLLDPQHIDPSPLRDGKQRPILGGSLIYHREPNQTSKIRYCSAGLGGRKRDNDHKWVYFTVTAGHCILPSSGDTDWHQGMGNGASFGNNGFGTGDNDLTHVPGSEQTLALSTVNGHWPTSHGDAGLIRLTLLPQQVMRQVAVRGHRLPIRDPFRSVQSVEKDRNQQVCKSGVALPFMSCGNVTLTKVREKRDLVNGHERGHVDRLVLVCNAVSHGGDSGGTVFAKPLKKIGALGILHGAGSSEKPDNHSKKVNCFTYTPIERFDDRTNISILGAGKH